MIYLQKPSQGWPEIFVMNLLLPDPWERTRHYFTLRLASVTYIGLPPSQLQASRPTCIIGHGYPLSQKVKHLVCMSCILTQHYVVFRSLQLQALHSKMPLSGFHRQGNEH